MNGKEYLRNKEKVLDMRKTFEEQKTILTDCYHWKDVYEALRLESSEVEHKHQVSMQCAREGAKENCVEIIKRRIKWQKDLIEQAEGKENIINTCECVIHQLEEIIKQIYEAKEK